jgi:hypothetical protein
MEEVREGERRVIVLDGVLKGMVAPFEGQTERDDLVEREGSVERSKRRGLIEEDLIDSRNQSGYVQYSSSAEKATYRTRHESSAAHDHRPVKLRRGDSPDGGRDETEGNKSRGRGVLGKVVEELWGKSFNEGGRGAGKRKSAFVGPDGELVLGMSELVVAAEWSRRHPGSGEVATVSEKRAQWRGVKVGEEDGSRAELGLARSSPSCFYLNFMYHLPCVYVTLVTLWDLMRAFEPWKRLTFLVVTFSREEPAFISLILLASSTTMPKAASIYILTENYRAQTCWLFRVPFKRAGGPGFPLPSP